MQKDLVGNHVDYDAFLSWCEDRFDSVVTKGKEIKLNSIFTDDSKFHLWCNVDGGVHHREDGCYRCFKTEKWGTLVGLVMHVDGCSYKEAKDILSGLTPLRELEKELDEFYTEKKKVKETPAIPGLTLPDYTWLIRTMPSASLQKMDAEYYLEKRKIPISNLCMCTAGNYRNRIVIPYYDCNGKLIYWNSRALSNDGLRYQGPPKTCGVGKCFAKDTAIRMYDGSTKKVQQIIDGDMVLGPDSQPRVVSGITSGIDELYKIIPYKGESFIVNSYHILTLKNTEGDVFEISVKDFLAKPDWFKRNVWLYRSAVNFHEKTVPIEPYVLGLWLGDGSSKVTAFTNKDEVLIEVWYAEANKRGLYINIDNHPDKGCATYHITGKRLVKNSLLEHLRQLNVYGNKHVPLEYIRNSRDVRLQLLAGFLDTDGHLINKCYEFSTKFPLLGETIATLSRSLGFACTIREVKKKSQTGFEGHYLRGHIYGNIDIIPVRLTYKKAKQRLIHKDVLNVGIKSVEAMGVGKYYGFVVDQDHLFLLHDFTVVHNSDVIYMTSWPKAGSKIYVTEGEFDAMSLNVCGLNGAACGGRTMSDAQVLMLKDYQICLTLDTDEAGYQGLLSMSQKLMRNGVNRITYVRPPVGYKDWNTMLVKHDDKIMLAYIEQKEKLFDDWTAMNLEAFH